MRYVNAAQAARMLGIGDKTIRRWLKEGKKLPGTIVKVNGEYAIPENEVEELRQHRLKYASPRQENVTSHDQSADITALAAKVADLERELLALKQSEKKPLPLEQEYATENVTVPSVSTFPSDTPSQKSKGQKVTTTAKKRGTDLPKGALSVTDFGRNHGVKRETFRDHVMRGLGPGLIHGPDVPEDGTAAIKDYVKSEERIKRAWFDKDGKEVVEKERYLTADQQAEALKFWEKWKVPFTACDHPECPCHLTATSKNL